ncbi:MAG: SRPBCC domain-containing protein [Pseudomonadota bacterium]
MKDDAPFLMIRRTFAAPVDWVYRAWTDPAIMQQWFCPGDMTVASASADVRVGGRYEVQMQEPSGELRITGGIYKEVVPNAKLVFSWAWQGSDQETQVTVELTALAAEETRMTLTHKGFVDEAARDAHDRGWRGCLDKLPAAMAALS